MDSNPNQSNASSGGSNQSSKYGPTTALHGLGVLLSVAALAMVGLDNPRIGLPIAVGTLAALGIGSPPPSGTPPVVLKVVRGGIGKGGMKQGAFIKLVFAAALFYRGVHPVLVDTGELALPSLLLGAALFVTGIGTGLEARAIGQRLEAVSERSGAEAQATSSEMH